MEQNTDILQVLELIPSPAFCVKDGIVTAINPEAQRCGLTVGQSVKDFLLTGQQEYPEFREGCLHLTVKIAGVSCGACVNRMQDFDVFVTEQDAELAQLQAMALAAQELRTPLSNIMAVADDLFPLCGSDGDALTAQLNKGLYQLQRIVCNMSDAYRYSRENSARLEIRDMGAFWSEFFSHSTGLFGHANVNLHFTGLTEKVFSLADGEKLERAANNVLSNALKFTPAGGNVDASLTRRGNMLYLTIQNSGSGTPAELRSNLFDRFLRQPSIEDTRYGIGLGMVLIRSVASMHGGTVLLEQTQDGGLRLTISMAIRQKDDTFVYSAPMRVDYAGERDHALIELSECLPSSLYAKEKTK